MATKSKKPTSKPASRKTTTTAVAKKGRTAGTKTPAPDAIASASAQERSRQEPSPVVAPSRSGASRASAPKPASRPVTPPDNRASRESASNTAASGSNSSPRRKSGAADPGDASIVSPAGEPLAERIEIELTTALHAEESSAAETVEEGSPIAAGPAQAGYASPQAGDASLQSTAQQTATTSDDDAPDGTSLLGDDDIYLFNEGSHNKLYDRLGAHVLERGKASGTNFAVWAPNAATVSVVGDFNGWDNDANPLQLREKSGIWEGFIPGVGEGAVYKYHIVSSLAGYVVDKADPFAFRSEVPPQTASIVWKLDYQWKDDAWMSGRAAPNDLHAPLSIYEMHIGSWRRDPADPTRFLSYRELAEPLARYVTEMGFTHVELLPVMEHPFYGSWGYQVTGFFSASSRFGSPQDLMYLIDYLHQHDIGVILDWVPSHFPSDEHGLSYFDGTHLFEHADPRKGFHPDWGSLIFNYGRNEVRSFLLSSALFWIERFHADGLRVDAVASMLYLDYSRKADEWIPNEYGGRENLEAITFLRRLNEDVYKAHPDVQVIAEESTAWPMVSRPTYIGGLGFGMKWDMGWMHDTLRYFSHEAIHRKFHHNSLTFRAMYAFTENFVLPLSHDEVVHGKGSLIGKMAGDEWRRFANLRLLFGHQYSQPGKKLLFMGGEFGQVREWNHDAGLDWDLTQTPFHGGLQHWVTDLNAAYRRYPALYELDVNPAGFEWIDCCDTEQSVISLLRRAASDDEPQVVIVLNFTPVVRTNYQIGLPFGGYWREILNSDSPVYGGSGQGNLGGVEAAPIPLHGRKYSANLTLPPLGAIFLVNEKAAVRGNVVMLEPADDAPEIPEERTA
jgi:1,4-alpha-glucan branching enzyme